MKRIKLKDQNVNDVIVQEGKSFPIIVTFEDVSPTPKQLTASDILTLELTLFSGTTAINSRNAQSVKNENGGTLADDGTLTMKLLAADNPIVDNTLTAGALETHIARFVWTWNDGADQTGGVEYEFKVEKLAVVV